jgi:hypothetical protein
MAYTLTASRQSLSEGESVVFSLNGTGLPSGTLVPFTISGTNINSLDYTGVSGLSGNFVIRNDKSDVILNLVNDLKTEGPETLILRLTGQNRTESIAITIADTSILPSANIAEFTINPNASSAFEGQSILFKVTAKNVSVGTIVPYTIIGIQSNDVFNTTISGNLIFQANTSLDTVAAVNLQILEDNETEGNETALMILNPDFPYSLLINGSVLIYDSSTIASQKLNVSSNYISIVEGSNVTFTVNADNVPIGTNVFYQIIPWTSWDTPSDLFPASNLSEIDFIGLSSFTGKFPPLTQPTANSLSNVTSITFTTIDDFIFEPTEYFYLSVFTDTNLSAGSPIVSIRDSGNTYLRSTSLFSGNVVVSFLEEATLTANIGGTFTKLGEWQDTTGQLSNFMVIQGNTPFAAEDSDIYYQPFSYVIRSSRSIDDWLLTIKDILHPAGFAIFSEINNETSPDNLNYAGMRVNEDSEIFTYSSIGADSIKNSLNVSNISISGVFNKPLTADLVFLETNPQ